MKTSWWKISIIVVLVGAVVLVIASKNHLFDSPPVSATGAVSSLDSKSPATPPAAGEIEKKLPKLLDLGAKKCIPCKMMAPILEELAKQYKGKLDVEFIDVWQNPGEAEKHGIRSIPTQIFYDSDGKEFFRHVGFFSKEDILAKFKEKGITF